MFTVASEVGYKPQKGETNDWAMAAAGVMIRFKHGMLYKDLKYDRSFAVSTVIPLIRRRCNSERIEHYKDVVMLKIPSTVREGSLGPEYILEALKGHSYYDTTVKKREKKETSNMSDNNNNNISHPVIEEYDLVHPVEAPSSPNDVQENAERISCDSPDRTEVVDIANELVNNMGKKLMGSMNNTIGGLGEVSI